MDFFRIIGSSAILLIYGLAVGVGCFAPLQIVSFFQPVQEKNSFYLELGTDQPQHTGIIQRTVFLSSPKALENPESPTSGIEGGRQVIAGLWQSRYKQIVGFSFNFPVRYRKADLIFPFHYFW